MDRITSEEMLRDSVSYQQTYAEKMRQGNGQASTVIPLWPCLASEALSGLAGEIVATINPYTEADPVAVLLHLLVAFGNAINSSAHVKVEKTQHPARLFAVLVGDTAKGRKGTAWSTPKYLFSRIDSNWIENQVKGGLSSGEGLIFHVRDPITKTEPIKEGKRVVRYEEITVDQGVKDKRLLVTEGEFASALTVMGREGNILSAVIREAWDGEKLSPLTKNNPITATNAHISIIGHITKQELLARMDETSKANGFANRFLWALVKRSKVLPEGGEVPDELLLPIAEQLREVITFARNATEVKRDDEARALWAEVYPPLTEGKPGLLGAVVSRAEAQVLRLSLTYALFGMSRVITAQHLKAALAVWEYCEQSAMLIFGQRLGDPTADRIMEAIRNAGEAGMSDTDIYGMFGGNKSANERNRAIDLLLNLGRIAKTTEATQGRPRTVYRAT